MFDTFVVSGMTSMDQKNMIDGQIGCQERRSRPEVNEKTVLREIKLPYRTVAQIHNLRASYNTAV